MGQQRMGLLVALLFACSALHVMAAGMEEGAATLSGFDRDDGTDARGDLDPDEADGLDKIGDVKSLKKYIFNAEKQTEEKEISKLNSGEGEEIAIGDTLKEMESEHAVEDEMQSEIQIDCEVGEWGKFSACDKPCDGGQMRRERTVTRQPQNAGAQCEALSNEVECNTESCASEAYQRQATRRKLTSQEKARETMANAQKIRMAMEASDTYTMMKRTREVMRKMVHTEVAEVHLPGEEGDRSDESVIRKSLQEAMSKNAVDNAMATYDSTKEGGADDMEADKKDFQASTQSPVGKRPVQSPDHK